MQPSNTDEILIPARVTATHKERYIILTDSGEKSAVLKSSVFYNNQSSFEHPTTGDFVLVKPNASGQDMIYAVYNRKSSFTRFDAFNGYEQVVAVNFDYVFIVSSLNNDYKISRIERYVSTAWESGGMPVIVLTKADLCPDFHQLILAVKEIAAGIPIIAASVISGEGIAELSKYFAPGKTSVLLGSSGVGKSSLVNAVAGYEIMKINDIRIDDDKGRHTTTHRQMIILDNNSMIIDTPGMREIAMWDSSEGINAAFTEIDSLIQLCRFPNCKHRTEPGCAVRAALKSGALTQQRLSSYYQLKKEAAHSAKKERLKMRFDNKLEKKKDARQFKAEKRSVKNTLKNYER